MTARTPADATVASTPASSSAASSSPERILVVSPYAPYRDGIAAYAVQQVKMLRASGHVVEVLSPEPSAAHHHLNFFDLGELRRFAALARRFDRVIVHFHPAFLFPQPITLAVRLRYFVALGVALRLCPPTTMVLHEINQDWATSSDLSRLVSRFLLQSFSVIDVHDRVQAAELREVFGVPDATIRLVEHGAHFFARTRRNRSESRRHLGLGADDFVFLCIGFVAEHKGFDRAVRALRRVRVDPAEQRAVRLAIVGSPSPGSAAAEVYAHDLHDLVRATPGAELHESYVSDARFDEWLLAADVVLLPYRLIWSSSVLERAAMFGCQVVASDVGGLAERVAELPGGRTVRDDAELVSAMEEGLAGAGISLAAVREPDEPWAVAPGEVATEVCRRAADRRGYPLRPMPATRAERVRTADPVAQLRRIGPLARPIPASARPGVTVLKRLERRLWDWELAPLIHWVDEIRRATQRAFEGDDRT